MKNTLFISYGWSEILLYAFTKKNLKNPRSALKYSYFYITIYHISAS